MKSRLVLAGLLSCTTIAQPLTAGTPTGQPVIGHRAKGIVTVKGLRFHDLNGDGQLTPYEDWRLSPQARATDLVGRMTLPEKAGLLMHAMPRTVDGKLTSGWDLNATAPLIKDRHIRFFISRLSGDPVKQATVANSVQELAEQSRLGIPIVISSDPRNQANAALGLSSEAGRFSLWPEFPGFGAIRDTVLMEQAARIMAREYRAVGIRMALSPMADLATEPQWPRTNGTFGDDPKIVGSLAAAYVVGMQGGRSGVTTQGVASVVKHWVGYGAEPDGLDAHNPYGRHLSFSSNASLATHIAPFLPSFAVHAAGVMPTYGILPANVTIAGKPAEPVGAGFNKPLLTTLLRGRYRFDGIVLSDWKITDNCDRSCEEGTLDHEAVGMPWGVETLSPDARFAKAIDAGVDQFGGVTDADIVIRLVQSGQVTPARLDRSVERLAMLMFRLGLFENAYVSPEDASRIVGAPEARAAGLAAQKRSLTLLVNKQATLPLSTTRRYKVWLSKISDEAARAAGLDPVDRPEDADISILRISTPFTQHKNFFFGARHHEGMPEFLADNADAQAVARAARVGKPVIVSVYLDRPAILTSIMPHVSALIGDYGVEDTALLDVITGRGAPQGRLPFELPRSAEAVAAQKPDLPSDSRNPLFPRGFGLSWPTRGPVK
ncbi:glycoside hydrolase family 3 N-terminal domain-containing protein [Sphingobium sp.]|uniref:glycoside hydrolase family 3 protein n=1 Tax=Sphingobium sp. TaxID=1912891 RepID=UPI0035C7895E